MANAHDGRNAYRPRAGHAGLHVRRRSYLSVLDLTIGKIHSLWNYNPDNDDERGDDWHGENFSWFSRRRAVIPSLLDYDQSAATLDVGGRILRSVVRPYPAKTAGVPLRFEYEVNTGEFTFEWAVPETKADGPDQSISQPSVWNPPRTNHPQLSSNVTEIYVPWFLTDGSKVVVRGLGASDSYRYVAARQTLYITVDDMTPGKVYSINVSLAPRLRAVLPVNDVWTDFGGHIVSASVVVLALLAYLLTLML